MSEDTFLLCQIQTAIVGGLLPIGHQISFNVVGSTVGDIKNRIVNEVVSSLNNSTDKNIHTPISITLLSGGSLINNFGNDTYTLSGNYNAYMEVFGATVSSGTAYFNYRLTGYGNDKIIFGQVNNSVFLQYKEV